MQFWDGVFPNRSPTAVDLVAACGAVLFLAISAPDVHRWYLTAVGAVAGVIVMGPLAQTPIGRRVGSTLRDIGIAGRGIVLALGIVAVAALPSVLPVPTATLIDVTVGVIVAIPVYVLAHLVVARDIDGWRPD